MKKLKSSGTVVLPYALSVTKTSLQTVQTLSTWIHPPCVAPVVAAALQIITMVEGMQSNREECSALQKRISDLAIVTSKPWVGKTDRDIPGDTRIMINSLRGALESTRTDLEDYTKAHRLKKLLLYKGLGQTIKSCSVKLDFAMQLFQIEALMATGANFATLASNLDQLPIHSAEVASDPPKPDSLIVARPPMPEIFFGREDVVQEITQRAVSTPNARLAILGDGGIGKTSVACAVLTDDLIVATFDGGLTWISCAEASSVSMFVELLTDSLSLPKQSPNRLSDVITWLQSRKGRQLLVFDNFETPWDIESRQADVERILCALVAIPQVSILITMRGRVPPSYTAGLKWTQPHLAPLPVLSLDAARQLYLEIDPTAGSDPSLDFLLSDLDYVPLAVTLMAKVGLYGDPPTALLSRWRNRTEGVNVLNLGDNELSSVQLSIELSLHTNIMKRKPQAERLLRILALLPAGARRNLLPKLAPSLCTMEAILPLLQTSLVSLDSASQTFRVLSPIRQYMLQYRPAEPPARRSLQEAYFSLLDENRYAGGARWEESLQILSLEESNLEAILLEALPFGEESTVRAAVTFGEFQLRTRYRLEVIETCARIVEAFEISGWLPECFGILGGILLLRHRYDDAEPVLKRARYAFEQVGYMHGAASCLFSLGEISRARGLHNEAWSLVCQAQEAYERIGSVGGVADCLKGLGDILYMRTQYNEAEAIIKQAQDAYERAGSVLGVAECLKTLGDIFCRRDQFEMATSALQEAQKMYLRRRNFCGAANCLKSLGQVLCSEGKHDEAEWMLKRAHDEYVRVGNITGTATCLRIRAEMTGMNGRYDEAALMLVQAQGDFERVGNASGVANYLWSFGNLYIDCGRYDDAKMALTQAHTAFERLGNAVWVVYCLERLDHISVVCHRNAKNQPLHTV